MTSRFLLLPLAALAATLPASAQQAEPDAPTEILDYLPDESSRMTVPVNIGASGPYRFLVDTGSERTVIARELAQSLGLGAGTTATVHSLTEVGAIRTALIPALVVGRRTVANIHAPMLERRHLGAEGMLGVDSLQSHRVTFDFGRRQMQLTRSRTPEIDWPAGAIVVIGRRLHGRLVLFDVDVDGIRIRAVVDTGAEVTIGNSALRRSLERRALLRPTIPVVLYSVTGGRMTADATQVGRIRIGGIGVHDMPIAFADVRPFRKLGLGDRPALLLGMDVLQLFDLVSIDFANRQVRLLPLSEAPRGVRLARAGTPTAPAAAESRSPDSGPSPP